MISGCYEGVPYVAWGTEKGLQTPELLRDREGGLMHAGRLWSPETEKHTGSGPRAYAWLPFDVDADGDLDLIVGTNDGVMLVRENVGSAQEPKFAAEMRGGSLATVPGGYAMPVAADWDGDGHTDLVSGAKDGSVWWFRNLGEKALRLAKPQRLVGSTEQDGAIRAQVGVGDYDADGDLDLLVGRYERRKVGDNYERHGYVWLYERVARPAAAPGQGGGAR